MKTWLITGASSGFGRLLTERLLARGDNVVATVRSTSALDDLAHRAGERLQIVLLDVTDTEAIRRSIDGIFADSRRIDVVVSNAGYGLFGAAEEVDDDHIRRQIDTNLIGSIQLIRAVLPHLRGQGGGRILQLSSEGGQIAYPNFSIYHAAKWGIEGFVEAVAKEVASFGIAVTLVEPGPTKTGFGDNLVTAPALEAYSGTAAGEMRRAMSEGQSAFVRDDPEWMVEAIIACADRDPAPRRLTLGSGSFERIRSALLERLAALEVQEAIARGMD